ncbi:phosphate-starvation-inducible PsiE family protein [Nguyenibacter vanlangensis]|uniref:Phosphate-starvation-inducible PsiE family protein n=1 Tax=Nguyenibacter vanlangensis TaxID=1216886 RepID=A0ABZ3DAY2_9PROT
MKGLPSALHRNPAFMHLFNRSLGGIYKLFDGFEIFVNLVLTFLIIVITSASLYHLVIEVFVLLFGRAENTTSIDLIQGIFGMFFTVLIAMEFKHSIITTSDLHPAGPARMRSVILIGLLATVRKFIVADLQQVNAMDLFALSGAVLSLGSVYYLIRRSDTPPQGAKRAILSPDADHAA